MASSILGLVLDVVFGLLTLLLLGRFVMQWRKLSFRNQLGQFVFATTDWLVRPLRRFIPGLGGLDLASLLPAWWLQVILAGIEVALFGYGVGDSPLSGALILLTLGALYLLRTALYLLMAVVLIGAVLSWVNPYSPIAPLVHALGEPFLRPLRRLIPSIANVDLSPLVLLVFVQILLILLDGTVRSLRPLLAGTGI